MVCAPEGALPVVVAVASVCACTETNDRRVCLAPVGPAEQLLTTRRCDETHDATCVRTRAVWLHGQRAAMGGWLQSASRSRRLHALHHADGQGHPAGRQPR